MSNPKQSSPTTAIIDPSLYRRMSEPFESADEANDAIGEFYAELRTIREKYSIADVHVIVDVNIIGEHGEYQAASSIHCGDSLKAEGMLAWDLGRAQRDRQEIIGSLMSRSGRVAK